MTNTLSIVKLAHIVAEVRGWKGKRGGWIYDSDDRRICQGWEALATALRRTNIIDANGRIDWRRMDLAGDCGITGRIALAAPKHSRG